MRLSHNLFRSERFDEATLQIYFGGDGKGDTPVTIPNTEVKPFSADGTAWEAVWESRTPPKYLHIKSPWTTRIMPACPGAFLFGFDGEGTEGEGTFVCCLKTRLTVISSGSEESFAHKIPRR